MAKAWLVNCSSFLTLCWHLVENFMDKATKESTSIHSNSNPESLIANFHPSQLEKKFGG